MRSEGLDGFEAAFERCFDEVYGYVAYRVAPDVEAAADLTQEVFLAALKGWGRFRGDASPLTWLRAIARRKVADHFRARPRAEPPTIADVSEAPSGKDEAAQDKAVLISRVMGSLPGDYADLLEEKYLEGLSVRQIARRRKASQQAVSSALHRAREAFRETFLRLQTNEEMPQ